MPDPFPQLPSPVPSSEMEKAYREDEPAGLFPPNQDSYFGLYRKAFTDRLQDVANQVDLLFNENFIATSSEFLNFHEEEAGLPALTGQSIAYRQQRVFNRIKKGLFSRTRRNSAIEGFIVAALGGTATMIGTGIAIGSGLTLFSGITGDPKNYYKVVENIPNFSYTVYIDVTLGVDMNGLVAELNRITPGGIGFAVHWWSNNKTGGGISRAVSGASSHHP